VPNGMESVVTMNDEIERYGSAFYRREVASV
jgi:hypothetical protein